MGSGVRRWWWVAGAVAVVGVSLGAWVLWPEPKPAPRARLYSDFSACLLTDDHGLAGVQAAPVWAGMQEASLATRAKVSYLAVTGAATTENAAPFLAGLVQRRCDVVVAVGPAQVSAVTASAATFTRVRFVVVGGGGDSAGGNVTRVGDTAPDSVRSSVRTAVASAARSDKGH
jgi:hypothetical protein